MSVSTNKFEKPLSRHDFARGKTEKQNLVNAIKALMREVYNGDFCFGENFSFPDLIQSRFSVVFMEAEIWFVESERKTIAQRVIDVRINKVKELLVYTDLPLETMARKLNYPSAAALSDELLQQTGLPASFFMTMKKQRAYLSLRQRLLALNSQ